MTLDTIGHRFIECVACLMSVAGGLLGLALPFLAPFVHHVGLRVSGPMYLLVPFACGMGLVFLAVGLALWPARLATARVASRMVARYPKLARLNTGSWVGGIAAGGFGMIMPSVALLYERPTGPGWENFWILMVVGAIFLLVAALIASPVLRSDDSDAMFYVISAVVVSGFTAVAILVAAGRATGGRMNIVEPILWGVCAVLVAMAGTTWRDAWLKIRAGREPPTRSPPD